MKKIKKEETKIKNRPQWEIMKMSEHRDTKEGKIWSPNGPYCLHLGTSVEDEVWCILFLSSLSDAKYYDTVIWICITLHSVFISKTKIELSDSWESNVPHNYSHISYIQLRGHLVSSAKRVFKMVNKIKTQNTMGNNSPWDLTHGV